jgi:hypothetical protein
VDSGKRTGRVTWRNISVTIYTVVSCCFHIRCTDVPEDRYNRFLRNLMPIQVYPAKRCHIHGDVVYNCKWNIFFFRVRGVGLSEGVTYLV